MFFTKLHALKKRKQNTQKAYTLVEMILVAIIIAILTAGAFFGYSGLAKHARQSTMKSDLNNIRIAATAYSALSKTGSIPNGNVTVEAFTLDAANSMDGTTKKFLSGQLKDPWGNSYTINSSDRTIKCNGSTAEDVPATTVSF